MAGLFLLNMYCSACVKQSGQAANEALLIAAVDGLRRACLHEHTDCSACVKQSGQAGHEALLTPAVDGGCLHEHTDCSACVKQSGQAGCEALLTPAVDGGGGPVFKNMDCSTCVKQWPGRTRLQAWTACGGPVFMNMDCSTCVKQSGQAGHFHRAPGPLRRLKQVDTCDDFFDGEDVLLDLVEVE